MSLAHQIATSGLKPETNDGWKMAHKFYFGEYNPNKNGFDEETTTSFDYYLSPEGKFICKKKQEKEYFKQDPTSFNTFSNKEKSRYECCLLEIMKEMDFEGYILYDRGSSWHEHGDSIRCIETQGIWNLPNSGRLDIKRKVKVGRKGQKLYKKLKAIVDSAATYIEECNRINSAYKAEYELQKQKITEEYTPRRNYLQQEQNNAINDAKKNEPQRMDSQSQINSMKNELSSLGFFARKKKKELQTRIDELERKLTEIPTVENVSNMYAKKMDELNQQEQKALTNLEKELRKKYPLPSQN